MTNESVAKRLNGKYYSKSLQEVLDRSTRPPASEKSAEEIAVDVIEKAGLVITE